MITRKVQARCVSPVYSLRVFVCQDDPAPLLWIKSLWGGTVRKRRPRPNGKAASDWIGHTSAALTFLRDIRPYLQVKGGKADIAIAFQSAKRNPGGAGYSPAENERFEAIRLALAGKHPGFVKEPDATEAITVN